MADYEKSKAQDNKGTSAGLEMTSELPVDAKTNVAGVPTYAGLSGSRLSVAITLIATTGFLLFGYDQGLMSGLLTGPQFIETFPACDEKVQGPQRASLLQATYTSVYEVGCLIGAVFALMCGDKLGRRRMLQIGSIILSIGVIISFTPFKGHLAGHQFIVGRVITGLGNGINTATIPTWQSETSPSHNRGLHVCIEGSFVAIGTAIAYWIDFGLSFVPTSINWRLPIALQLLFSVLLFTGVWFLPESPRWLLHHGHHVEGQRVIAALAGTAYDSEATQLQTRLITQSIEQSHEQGAVRKRNLFTNGPTQHFRRAALGVYSQAAQQLGGCNAAIYFAPLILQQNLGLDRQLSLILGGCVVTCYALAALGSYGLIERVGRRKMYLWGTVGQCLSMVIIFSCYIGENRQTMKGSVVGIFLYLIFFGATWLELPWLYPAEINPIRTRTNANAASTITNWMFNAAVVQFTPPMLTSLKWGTFLFFACVNASFIPVLYLWFPETSGRTLEEIDLIFAIGYAENKSYVKVADEMPHYAPEEVQVESMRLHAAHQDRMNNQRTIDDFSPEGTIVEDESRTKTFGPKRETS